MYIYRRWFCSWEVKQYFSHCRDSLNWEGSWCDSGITVSSADVECCTSAMINFTRKLQPDSGFWVFLNLSYWSLVTICSKIWVQRNWKAIFSNIWVATRNLHIKKMWFLHLKYMVHCQNFLNSAKYPVSNFWLLNILGKCTVPVLLNVPSMSM